MRIDTIPRIVAASVIKGDVMRAVMNRIVMDMREDNSPNQAIKCAEDAPDR